MIYNTIADMLAETSNLELISDRRVTDGYVGVDGAEWFKFKGLTANALYACGRGWVNFGDQNEGGLKVNFRRQFLMRLYREEGAIGIEDNHFIRVRWDGYTMYKNNYEIAEKYSLIFDLVICDTNDIILNIVHYPTECNDGENQLEALETVTYTPSENNLQFTFLHQDSQGNEFTKVNGIREVFNDNYTVKFNGMGGYGTMPNTKLPVDVSMALPSNTFTKGGYRFLGWDTNSAASNVVYTDGQSVLNIADAGLALVLYAVWQITWGWLIKSGSGTYYGKAPGGGISAISGVSELTADVFKQHGFQYNPPGDSIKQLNSPTIYKWSENSLPTFLVKVSAIPSTPQLVAYQTITLPYDIDAVAILDSGNDVLWNVSFDNGTTWKKFNGTQWVTVTIEGDGCTYGYIEMLTPVEWKQVVSQGDTLKFRAWISENGWIKEVRIDYVEAQS